MADSTITISALFSEFDQWAVVQNTTKRKCKFAMRKLIGFCGDIAADKLTSAMAGRFQTYMKNTGMSDGSVGSYFAAASEIFNWAVEQKEYGLEVNPFAGAKKIRPGKLEIHTYKSEEIDALLQAVNLISWRDPVSPLRWTGLFLCGLHGLRVGEIWNLRWDDLDLDAGVIQVQSRPDKKDEYWQWSSKSKAEREVPMSQSLWECLYRLQVIVLWRYPFLKYQRYCKLQSQIGSLSEFTRKSPYNNFYREFARIRKAAEIKSGGLQQMRRTAGTHLANRLPIHETQNLLGHASVKTTLGYYVHVDKQRCLRNGREAFDQLGPVGFEPTTNGL